MELETINVLNRWENFSINEIINPYFDDCPAKNSWDELPIQIQTNLMRTMDIVQEIRTYMNMPFRLNSTWRLHDAKGKSHREGKAVDFQPSHKILKHWGTDIINWLRIKKNDGYTIAETLLIKYNIRSMRLFWEYSGNNYGWIHIDTNYRVEPGQIKYYVGYPVNNQMRYDSYIGTTPMALYERNK